MVKDLLNLFYPPVCMGCSDTLLPGEEQLCTACRHHVPIAYHDMEATQKFTELFYGRLDVKQCATLFYYEKIGSVQHLIHHLKYRKQEQVSSFLGKWMGQYMLETGSWDDIDLVIPVPVHRKRLRKRGYNQASGFGEEIASVLGLRFRESVLTKTRNTKKQAQLDQSQRIDETQSPYQLNETIAPGTKILLVDDVVTTGTTLSLCARALLQVPDVEVSMATMAISV